MGGRALPHVFIRMLSVCWGLGAVFPPPPPQRTRGCGRPDLPGGRSPCPPRKLLEPGAASSPDGGSALVEARPLARCRHRLLARRRRMAATGCLWSVLVASFRRRGGPVPLLGTVVSPVKPPRLCRRGGGSRGAQTGCRFLGPPARGPSRAGPRGVCAVGVASGRVREEAQLSSGGSVDTVRTGGQQGAPGTREAR